MAQLEALFRACLRLCFWATVGRLLKSVIGGYFIRLAGFHACELNLSCCGRRVVLNPEKSAIPMVSQKLCARWLVGFAKGWWADVLQQLGALWGRMRGSSMELGVVDLNKGVGGRLLVRRSPETGEISCC